MGNPTEGLPSGFDVRSSADISVQNALSGAHIPIVDYATEAHKLAIAEADSHREQLLPSSRTQLDHLLHCTLEAANASNAAGRKWHDLALEVSLRAGPLTLADEVELTELSKAAEDAPDARNNQLIPYFTKLELLAFRSASSKVEVLEQVWRRTTLRIPLSEGPLSVALRKQFPNFPKPEPPPVYHTYLVSLAFGVSRAYEDVRQALDALLQRVLVAMACSSDGSQSVARHSQDFASVYWFGKLYTFSPNQAACIRVLWEAWNNKTPVLGEPAIQEAAGVDSNLRNVFRDHEAWDTLITSPSKGRYRLSDPPH